MKDKPFKTHKEQIEILKSRGLIIDDEEKAINILMIENYYNLINGYKDLFIDKGEISKEKYLSNSNFNEILSIYKFDSELKNIFMKRLLIIETNIKSIIAYNFSQSYGDKDYLKLDNFNINCNGKSKKEKYSNIMDFLAKIQLELARNINKKSHIGHYMLEYGYVPLWVLINTLSFGTVSLFYRYMKQKDKQKIAKIYSIADNELEIIFKILSLARNICAHRERLYNFKYKNKIKQNYIHEKMNIEKNNQGYIKGRDDLFALLICIKILLEQDEFKSLVDEISNEIDILVKNVHSISIESILDAMGFPKNWLDIKN